MCVERSEHMGPPRVQVVPPGSGSDGDTGARLCAGVFSGLSQCVTLW